MFFVGNGFVAIAAREVPSGMTAMSIGSVPLFLSVMESAARAAADARCNGSASASASPASRAWVGRKHPHRRRRCCSCCFAAIGWASASLIVRRAAMPAGLMAGAAQLIGGGATLIARRPRASASASARCRRWSAGLAFGYLVVFGSIIGFSACVYLLRNAPASIATSYAYVNPVLAVLLGATLGGERIAPSALLAGLWSWPASPCS